jgi:hypothetical protein
MNCRNLLVGVVLAGGGLAAQASSITYKDNSPINTTPVGPDISAQVQRWYQSYHDPVWKDVIGHSRDFQTLDATATWGATDASIVFRTNMEEAGYVHPDATYTPADLFLDLNLDGNWDHAVTVTSRGAFTAGDLYQITPADIVTSEDLFSAKPTSYGGRYRISAADTTGKPVPVLLAGGTKIGSAPVTWNDLGVVDPGSLTVSLPGILTLGDQFLNPDFAFLWATANCGNDVVYGYVPAGGRFITPVPEPGTWAAGLGLAGVAAWCWHRRRRR